MKKLLISLLVIFTFVSIKAQVPDDALRYTRLNYTGSTARSASMSGAFGAVGGDFLSLALNPAGMAIYRSPEFSITPSIFYANSDSRFLGNKSNNYSSVFNIGNFGLVMPFEANSQAKQYGFKMFHFGIGVNRINNFQRSVTMRGYNESSSITTGWVDELNYNNPNITDFDDGTPILNGLDAFSTKLAWNTYLIDWATDASGHPYLFSDMYGGKVDQTVKFNTSGSQNEFDISGGFNWSDMLFFGATIGVPFFSYKESYTMIEEDNANVNDYFTEMTYVTNYRAEGSGINFKIGLIYKPIQWLRLGFAYHTPTSYKLDDTYEAELTTYLDLDGKGNQKRSDWSDPSYYEYNLKTPMRLMGSAAVVVGKVGLISVDYEYVDYSHSKFSEDGFTLDDVNDVISTSYTKGSNVNVGTEWSIGVIRLRAGYGYSSTPYASKSINAGGQRHTLSLGTGLRFKSFYTDFGYSHCQEEADYYPYSREYVSASKNTYNYNQFQLTFGFRF